MRVICIFLSSFIVDFEFTWEFVQKRQLEQELISVCLNEAVAFSLLHDRKLLVVTLSLLMHKATQYPVVLEKLPKILSTLISSLKATVLIEQNDLKGRTDVRYDDDEDEELDFAQEPSNDNKQILKVCFDGPKKDMSDEDEDDKEDEEQEEDLGLLERIDIMRSFSSELDKKDEFSVFREAVIALQKKDPVFFKELVGKLQPQRIEYLRDVVYFKRVIVGTRDDKETMKLRKVVSVKGIKSIF